MSVILMMQPRRFFSSGAAACERSSESGDEFDERGFAGAGGAEKSGDPAGEGRIGSVAGFHYSFMGAVSPVTRYEPKARELAGLLKKDQVDAVLLSPV